MKFYLFSASLIAFFDKVKKSFDCEYSKSLIKVLRCKQNLKDKTGLNEVQSNIYVPL